MDTLDLVQITEDNLESFAALIPSVLYDGIRRGEYLALGSMILEYPNGAIVASLDADAADILSVYVDMYDRRNKTGSFLIDKLCELSSKVSGIYSLRAALPVDAEQNGITSFFEAEGFQLSDFGGPEAEFTIASLDASPFPDNPPNINRCLSGDEVGSEALLRFEHTLASSGDYLMEKSLCDTSINQVVSRYYVENNTVRGCAVFSSDKEGELIFELAYVSGGTELLPLLVSVSRALKENFQPQTKIRLQAVNEASQKITEKLVPGAKLSYKKLARRTITI